MIYFLLFFISKITGPIGIWRPADGYVYAGQGVPESTHIQEAFKFGEFGVGNWAEDYGLLFYDWVMNTCKDWNSNKVIGLIRPPSDTAEINQPGDTALYEPYSISLKPGMIQAGQRFSRLSKFHGPIYGADIDEYHGVIPISSVEDIKDALKGKYVDTMGNVYHDSVATTPQNKMFVVLFEWEMNPSSSLLSLIDGISFWISNQTANYTNIDQYINTLRRNCPNKEIICGIYIKNSIIGWAPPASVHYMLDHLINRYDDGDINGIWIYSGWWLIMPNITREYWDSLNIFYWLDSLYYPYLGEGEGRVYDYNTNWPIDSAFVTVYTKGRVSGDTLIRSRQMTHCFGYYKFGAWAGNRNTDSTLYWVIGEKEGYYSDTVKGWIKRQTKTSFPPLYLRKYGVEENRFQENRCLNISPNPCFGTAIVQFTLPTECRVSMSICDLGGRNIKTLPNRVLERGIHKFKVTFENRPPPGVYFITLKANGKVAQKSKLIVL